MQPIIPRAIEQILWRLLVCGGYRATEGSSRPTTPRRLIQPLQRLGIGAGATNQRQVVGSGNRLTLTWVERVRGCHTRLPSPRACITAVRQASIRSGMLPQLY